VWIDSNFPDEGVKARVLFTCWTITSGYFYQFCATQVEFYKLAFDPNHIGGRLTFDHLHWSPHGILFPHWHLWKQGMRTFQSKLSADYGEIQ
jgi:hypothetical protein